MENKDKIIILFRHGEKISDDYPDLSPKGIARSECLPLLFESLGKQYTPTKIYANIRGKTKVSNYSTRASFGKKIRYRNRRIRKR